MMPLAIIKVVVALSMFERYALRNDITPVRWITGDTAESCFIQRESCLAHNSYIVKHGITIELNTLSHIGVYDMA